MTESFDAPPTAAEAQAAGFDSPPTAAEQGFETPPTTDEEARPNLGVVPMPSPDVQRAALAAPPTAQETAPGAYTLGGPAFTAFRAQNAGVSSDEATQALGHARKTGLAPQFVADALPEVSAQQEQSGFEDGLGAAPITAAWAGQSAVHAAAVKPDIGFFEALEQGLVDVGYQELATLQMTYPTEAVEQTLQGYEAEAPEYEARPSPWYADLARNVPQIATYMLSGVLGKMVGGKAGEVGATAGTMFLLNRGSLYRQIIHQMPIPASDEDPRSVGWRGVADYEQKARIYATAGAGASAVLGAGLSSAIGWMVPGAGKRVSDLSTGIIARAFTDEATRDVIGRLVGMGGHTLSGALQMAIPAVIDDATVQAAVRGSVDPGKAAVAGWQAFKTSILAAGALSVVPGLPGLVRDVGRIKMAEPEAGRLQHLVDQAQSAKLVKQAPEDAKELLGKMAVASDAPTVHVATNALAQNPAATQALVESLADGGQAIAEAKATGSDVPVPIENYLVDLGEHHDALKDDVKLDPEGMTPREAREAPATMRPNPFEASFKHKETGEVVETGRFHDIAQLPGGENADLDKWEAGFNDAQGKFLTREEAKASLPPELQAYTSPAGLESEDLTPMLRRETTRQREMVDRALQPAESLPSLMAQRDHVLQTEPDTPERTAKLSDIQDRMRSAAARGAGPEGMAGLGRIATPEEVAAASLEPPTAVPPPEPPSAPAPEWDSIAERTIEAKTIGELQPGRYERAATVASDRIARFAGDVGKAIEPVLQKFSEALNVSLDTIRHAVAGFYPAYEAPLSAGSALRVAEKEIRGAERGADVLEAGRLQTLRKMVEEYKATQATRLSDLTQARDLSRALAKKAGEARAEMDGLQDKLVRGYTDDARAKLNLADPAYLGVTDLLMGAVGLGPEVAGPQYGVADVVARMSSDARLLGFDAQAVAELAADPKPWKDLTPAEARNLTDALASIRAAARDVNEGMLADRRASVQQRTAELRLHFENLRRIPEDFSPLPAPSEASKGTTERAGEKVGKVRAEFHQPREILRRMGSVGREIWDEYLKARNYEAELQHQVGDRFAEALEDFPKEVRARRLDGVKGVGSPVVADNLWTRQSLWTLAGWFGSESGAQRLRAGLRITDDQVLSALSQLTKPEAKFIDSLHALSDETIWPLVRDHEVAKTGAHPPKIQARPFTVTLADGEVHTFRGGYWPGREAEPQPRGSEGDVSSYWGGLRDGFPSTSKPFTKERAETTSYRPDLNWSNYASHIGAVLHYLAYDDFVRNGGRLLRNKEFRDVAAAGLGGPGPQDVKELDKFVQIAARGRMEAPKAGATELGRIVGGGLRSRIAIAAFQSKVPLMLGQLSHLLATPFATEIGPLDMTQGAANALRPEKWAEYHAESKQLPYRWNGYGSKMREMLADVGPLQRSEAHRALDVVGHAGYHMMDGYLSASIYGAGKAEAETRGLSGADAARFADDKVATMMPPLNLAEQSSVARDRGLIGSLLLVRNFPNQLYNIGAQMAWNGHNRILAMDPGWQRLAQGLGVASAGAASYVGMMWGVHIAGRFIMGHGRQEDETTPQWLWRGMIASLFYPVPILSDVAEIGSRWAVSHKSLAQVAMHGGADIQSAPLLAELQDVIREVGEALNPGKSSEQRVVAGLRLGANIFGIGDYPLRPIQYGYDLQTGKARPRGPFDIAGGFLYGKRPKQARNPFTAAQDIQSGRFR